MKSAPAKPVGPAQEAMKSHASESRAWLRDLAFRVPFSEYATKEKLQTFELTLFLVLADRFEDGTDEERAAPFARAKIQTDLQTVRASKLYADLMIRVGKELTAMQEEEALDPATWVDRETARAQKVLSRALRHTTGARDLADAADEVLARKFPKATRTAGTNNVNLVVFRPEDGALMEKALRTISGANEKVLELTP
jgi:hypothetical protein